MIELFFKISRYSRVIGREKSVVARWAEQEMSLQGQTSLLPESDLGDDAPLPNDVLWRRRDMWLIYHVVLQNIAGGEARLRHRVTLEGERTDSRDIFCFFA